MDASKFFFVCLFCCWGGGGCHSIYARETDNNTIIHFQAKSDKTQQINVSHY